VTIDHPKGPTGHSDGDAVLHAIIDALTGAAGLDDVGTLFPDTDQAWKGADSARLLEAVVEKVKGAGFQIGNVDVVIATEGPRIAPVRADMRERIGALLGVGASSVNVKGKSLEGLGALAEGRGVAVQAICLLRGGE
jgi:2-C-methyl-D-erythritol 2,4-cyclodiphosphate synthase